MFVKLSLYIHGMNKMFQIIQQLLQIIQSQLEFIYHNIPCLFAGQR